MGGGERDSGQYFVIADDISSPACDNIWNKILTLAGYLHICLQPYFCHVINASLVRAGDCD